MLPLSHRALFLGLAVLVAIPLALLGRPVPCEVQANLTQQPAPAPVSDFATARTERVAFEGKRGAIQLENRTYTFDQAPKIASDSTITGPATWRNAHEASKHPLNAGAYAWGGNCGWVDAIAVGASKVPQVTLRDPSQVSNYPSGRLVYCWAAGQGPHPWFPYGVDSSKFGLVNQRRQIVSRNGATLTLDAAVDPRCTAITWLADAVPVNNVSRDTNALAVKDGRYWLTSGKSVADELRGEWVQVAGGQMQIAASRDYGTAAACAWPAVENVTIRNVTFARSPNPQGESLFCKFIRNWRFEGCTFQGPVAIASATDVEFVRCRFDAHLQLNTSTRVTVRDSILGGFSTDESDIDTVLADSIIQNAPVNGVRTGIDCGRITVQNVTIRDTVQCPLMIGGPDNLVESVRIFGDRSGCYLHGPRMTVRDLHSDWFVTIYNGSGQRADGVRANPLYFGWVNGVTSSGTFRDCKPVDRKPTAGRWSESP